MPLVVLSVLGPLATPALRAEAVALTPMAVEFLARLELPAASASLRLRRRNVRVVPRSDSSRYAFLADRLAAEPIDATDMERFKQLLFQACLAPLGENNWTTGHRFQ